MVVKGGSASAAGNCLTDEEVGVLYKYIADFDKQNGSFDWRGRLQDVAQIANKHKPMPLLVCQVLFYTAVACELPEKDGKPLATLDNIREQLLAYDLKLDADFFSEIRVVEYMDMLRYRQPNMLFKYLGQKDGALGVAIKNLVYQAGDYKLFLDVFGGSGAASLVFPRKSGSKYVYNDSDKNLYNLMKVIADAEKHEELIEYLELLQADLSGEEVDWTQFGLNFKDEALTFYRNRCGKGTKNEKRIINDLNIAGVEDSADWDFICKFMLLFFDILMRDKAEASFVQEIFGDWLRTGEVQDLVMSYFKNYYKIIDSSVLSRNTLYAKNITYVYEDGHKEDMNICSQFMRSTQLRFYIWYAVCDNMLEKEDTYSVDDVFRALATIYLAQFITHGRDGLSSLLRMHHGYDTLGGWLKDETKEWRKFLAVDFKSIITDWHSKLKNNTESSIEFVVENIDCRDLLDKYKDVDDVLIYLDSPYIATSQYKVGNFSSKAMEELLEKLESINKKFIFSCRACKSVAVSNVDEEAVKKKEVLLAADRKIYSVVFDKFRELFKANELYVLTIDEHGKGFWEIVSSNGIAEIMITNYKIHSFFGMDTKGVYSVEKFDDFMLNLDKSLKEKEKDLVV